MLLAAVAWLARHRARLLALVVLGSATTGLLAGQLVGITHVFAIVLPTAAIAGSLVFLIASHVAPARQQLRPRPHRPPHWTLSGTSTRLCAIAVCWLCLSAWAIALQTGGRGLLLYILCGLAGSFVSAQILFARPRDIWPGLFLVQILVVAATVRLPALLVAPSLTGVDIFTHIPNYAAGVVETGHVDEALTTDSGPSKYVAAPLFHTVVAATALLGDVSVRTAATLSVGLGMLAILPAVYCIARHLGLDARGALLATALVAGVDYAIHWTIHLIPSTLAVVFAFAALILLVRVLTRPASATARTTVCLVCLLVAIVLTDQVTAFIMVVILGVAVTIQLSVSATTRVARWRDHKNDSHHSPMTVADYTGFATFLIGCVVVSWAVTPTYGSSFLAVTAERGIDSIVPLLGEGSLLEVIGGESDPVAAEQERGSGDSLAVASMEYVARLGFALLLAGAATGTFAILRAPAMAGLDWTVLRGQPGLTVLAVTAVLGVIALAPPLLGITSLLPGRWYLYLYLFLALLTAVGLADVARQSPRTFVVCALVLVCVFPVAGIVAPTATPDAPLLNEEHPRYSYTGSEVSASETLREITVSSEGAPIRTDQPYQSTLTRPGDGQWYTLEAERTADGDASVRSADRVIYREYQNSGAPQVTVIGEQDGEQTREREVRQVGKEEICTAEHSIGYDNGDVRYCER